MQPGQGQGRNGHQYDPLRIERASFCDAILNLLLILILYLPLITFETEPVELKVNFTFNHNYILNDFDNLIKLVMDVLSDAQIYDNARQVMSIKARKRTGLVVMTQIAVHRHILVLDDDDKCRKGKQLRRS